MKKVIDGFLVLEGLDGAGTTTQKERIEKELTRRGCSVMTTNEPTSGEIGRLIRRVLKGEIELSEISVAYLFAADRAEHIYGKAGIIENIGKSRIVVSDRYFYSTLAYQSFELDISKIREINNFPHPKDLVFIDVEPRICIERIDKRGGEKEIFEKESLLERIRLNYLKAFENLPEDVNFIRIEGDLSIEETTERILERLSFL